MRTATALFLVVSIGLAACGGGGGGGGGGGSLSGWYESASRPNWPDWQTQAIVELEQVGDTLYFSGREFLREGDQWVNFAPSPVAPNRTESTLWVVAEGHLEGLRREFTGGSETDASELRLLRTAQPTGTLTASGTLQGHSISLQAAPAHATDGGVSGAYELILTSGGARSPLVMILAFSQDPPLSTVTPYVVGAPPLQGVGMSTEIVYANATGGTVPITLWETGRVRGTFDLTFAGGDAVTGEFDVPIPIHLTP